MEKRNRRFEYFLNIKDDMTLDRLKQINCKYHIIGISNDKLHAFVWFLNGKTEKSVMKIINAEEIKNGEVNSYSIYEKIKQYEDVWESDEVPKRINYNKQVKESEFENISKDELLKITKLLLNDNKMIKSILSSQTENNNVNIELLNKTNELTCKLVEAQKTLIEKTIITQNTMTYSANSNNNSSTDNSKNKKITNINVFLNTECKDAITMKDFINDLVIEDEDLMYLKQYGYVESVARLLNKALSNYDIYKRPIHCTDTKREVMHVKDQEGWKKEDPSGQSKNLDSAFTKLSQMQNRKMMSYYKGIDIDSPNIEEMAFVMKRISEVCGSEDAGKKKIIKKIIENIRL